MTTKRITQDKISRVSSLISSNKFNEDIEKIKETIKEKVQKYCEKFIDSKLLELWRIEENKYFIRKFKSFYLYGSNNNYLYSISLDLPIHSLEFDEHDFSKDEKLNKSIKSYVDDYQTLIKQKQTLRNKISCVLTDLKTYNRIKMSFLRHITF